MLGDRYILFAEWLVHHAVPYPEERYEKVYCFDVMEKETGKYLPQDQVKEMVTELGLTYVPVFYDGPFVSWKAISTTNRVRERMKNQKQICVRKNIKITYPSVHKSKTIKKC